MLDAKHIPVHNPFCFHVPACFNSNSVAVTRSYLLASLAVDDIGVHGENVLSFFELLHFWRRGLSGDNGPWWLNPLGYEPKGLAAALCGDVYTKKGITPGVRRGQSTDAASATET